LKCNCNDKGTSTSITLHFEPHTPPVDILQDIFSEYLGSGLNQDATEVFRVRL